MKESEARSLRLENEHLREENRKLGERLGELEARFGDNEEDEQRVPKRLGAAVSEREVPIGMLSDTSAEALYQTIKRRIQAEAPALLKVLAMKPELRVDVERQTIEAKGDSVQGLLAQLIAEGFFKARTSGGFVQKELSRRGFDLSPGTLYPALDALTRLGFLTVDEGKDERGRTRKEFQAVEGMKVNIVER